VESMDSTFGLERPFTPLLLLIDALHIAQCLLYIHPIFSNFFEIFGIHFLAAIADDVEDV
jgi:hypothetical protein